MLEGLLFLRDILLHAEKPDGLAVPAFDRGGYPDPARAEFRAFDLRVQREAVAGRDGAAAKPLQAGQRFLGVAFQNVAAHEAGVAREAEELVGSVAPCQLLTRQFALPGAHARGHGSPLEDVGAGKCGFEPAGMRGMMLDLLAQLVDRPVIDRSRQRTAQAFQQGAEGGLRCGIQLKTRLRNARPGVVCWITHICHRLLMKLPFDNSYPEIINRR